MNSSQQLLSDLTVFNKYARYNEVSGRRETYSEICDRYEDMMVKKYPQLEVEIIANMHYIRDKKVLPSMRAFQFAGTAMESNNARGFNCSYAPIKDLKVFSEIMFLLLSGCGVGFSVQKHHIEKLPPIQKQGTKVTAEDLHYVWYDEQQDKYVIEDSIEGWADTIHALILMYFSDLKIKEFDYSLIRPKGSRIVTSGGKCPGMEPLKTCIDKLCVLLDGKEEGRQLEPIEAHDICCIISDAVLAGGIRRCWWNTHVHTSKGLMLISELQVGDQVLGIDGEYHEVLEHEHTGKKQICTIDTSIGEYESSPNHRWAVLDTRTDDTSIKWVEAKDIKDYHRLLFMNKAIKGVKTELLPFSFTKSKADNTSIDIIIPQLDVDMAWFLGFLHGNGSVEVTGRKKAVQIAIAPDLPNTVMKVYDQLKRFGVNPKIKTYKHDKAVRVLVNSVQLAAYLSQYKTPNTSIVIPKCILQGTEEIRLGYLGGIIDSDGSYKSGKKIGRKRFQVLSTIYERYAKDIRTLIASLGYLSKVSYQKRKEVNWKTLYKVSLISVNQKDELATKLLGISEKTKLYYNFKLSKHKVCSIHVPTNILNKEKIPAHVNVSKSYIQYTSPKEINIDSAADVFNYNPLHYYIKVKSVEVTEKEVDMYDIQVANTQSFVAGGMVVHNSALISGFSPDDIDMLEAKKGAWWEHAPHRGRANNSAVLERDKTDKKLFDNIWKKVEESKAGEPGLAWTNNKEMFLNPCAEISLQPYQFCNLVEINACKITSQDSFDTICTIASFFGTLQAGFTDFVYLRPIWKETTDAEALIGVGITGIASGRLDNIDLARGAKMVMSENKLIANLIGIHKAARTCTVKPAGSTSCTLSTSSGIHAWHAEHYIRRSQVTKDNPVYEYLLETNPSIVADYKMIPNSAVIELPQKAPEGATTRDNETVFDLLDRILRFNTEWVHEGHRSGDNMNNVSATLSIKDDEWEQVGEYLWNNRYKYNGIATLPYDGGTYEQAPFETITEEEYERRIALIQPFDFKDIKEETDTTDVKQEIACAGGACEIVYN